VPLAVPSEGTVASNTAVSGIGVIENVTVSFHIIHSSPFDLGVFLIGPDGTEVELTTGNGFEGGRNYGTGCADAQRTTFDDAAPQSIVPVPPPRPTPGPPGTFAGTFRPEGLLGTLRGRSGADVNGAWTLRITDQGNVNAPSTLECWALTITER
jgi:subtilisin-like proprotein convertase family protein